MFVSVKLNKPFVPAVFVLIVCQAIGDIKFVALQMRFVLFAIAVRLSVTLPFVLRLIPVKRGARLATC